MEKYIWILISGLMFLGAIYFFFMARKNNSKKEELPEIYYDEE